MDDGRRVRLEAEVNPAGTVTESQRNNNKLSVTVPFVARNQLDIAYIAVCYQPDPTETKLCPSDAIATHDELLGKLFPVSAGGVDYHPFVISELVWREPLDDSDDVYEIVANLRSMYDMAEALGGDVPDQLAAWLPLLPEIEIPLGLADPMWMGSAGRITIQQDTSMAPVIDPVDAQFTLAHEISHNLGRFHVQTEDGCGSEDPFTDWPFDSGAIGELGFDPIAGQVVTTDKFDVMTYCSPPSSNIWISPFTYEKLFDGNLQPLGDPRIEGSDASRSSRTAHPPADYLVLQGNASSDGSSAELSSAYRITSTVADPVSDPFGNYCIHVSDNIGFLAKHCFTLDFTDERTQEVLAEESFSLIVPVPSGATHVALRHDNVELDDIVPSLHAPSLTITSPLAGDAWAGVQTITWTASDDDGDPLNFAVLHSPDGGATWTPLALDLSEPEFSFDTSKIPGGPATYFRVFVSDGWNTTTASVGPLTLPADRPWRNPTKPFDTNRNSTIEPLDVLVLINELNESKIRHPTTGRLLGHPDATGFYYDPTGDGFCTPLDALQIINFLNGPSGEGEMVGDTDRGSPLIRLSTFIVGADQFLAEEADGCSELRARPKTAEKVPLLLARLTSPVNSRPTSAAEERVHTLISAQELSDWLRSDRLPVEWHVHVDALFAADDWN